MVVERLSGISSGTYSFHAEQLSEASCIDLENLEKGSGTRVQVIYWRRGYLYSGWSLISKYRNHQWVLCIDSINIGEAHMLMTIYNKDYVEPVQSL
jgi:hypothetical protein